jgi:hypothetical protein
MPSFAPIVDVENVAGDARGQHLRRLCGWLEDQRTLAIASIAMGEEAATIEMQFTIDEAHALALAAFAGDRRALTSPGIARKLSATVAILFRVCHAAGALQNIGVGDDGGGDCGHRDEAADDEPAGN